MKTGSMPMDALKDLVLARHALFALFAAVILALAAHQPPAQADTCRKPLCQKGERYRADDNPAASFGWCHSSSGFGYKSHQRRECESGWTLERASGMCMKRDCCPERPLCQRDERYLRHGTRDGRTYGVCGSSSGLGYKSHTLRFCESGYELDTARGVCKQTGCGITLAPGGIVAPVPVLPPSGKKPDLVIRNFGLKSWGKCAPKNAVVTFQVTVANIGSAPSPAIPGKALVQVMDQHGNGWGNGKPLAAIAPGASQTVEVPVFYLASNPGHMTSAVPHPFKAIADPLKLVDELNEGNNDSTVVNVGAPAGCPKP